MLSKVLARGSGAAGARPLVFADLPGYRPGADIRAISPQSLPAADLHNEGESAADMRNRLRQIESQADADRRDAFESGRKQGAQEAHAEIQPVLQRLADSVTEVLSMRADIRHGAEQDVVQLALLIARRVMHRQLTVDTDALTAIARVAFDRLTRSESYRVTVHPRFAAAITQGLAAVHGSRVQVDPDPACALGALIVHSADGTIDASIDTQLEEIERGLTDRLARVEG